MQEIKSLSVKYNGCIVGRLAANDQRLSAFEYNNEWLLNGFSISPFSLPLKQGLFLSKSWEPFEGLFGIFADSLPDGWGRLLVDRMLSKNGIAPHSITALQRLAIVGQNGMGALSYEPATTLNGHALEEELDILSASCKKILLNESSDDLDALFKLGGSSGGARPKILTDIEKEKWIIKFPSTFDAPDIGEEEYLYSLCAAECGIEISKTRLFPSKISPGFFGTKRFDVTGADARRVHTASVSALLETSHKTPNLDYSLLMKLTLELTKDYSELEKMFRLMCFNVFAHNRDDHSKNFSFVYDEGSSRWKLSPAYDLTYSNSIGGEHATTIAGNGRDPGMADLISVAKGAGLNITKAKNTAQEIEEKTQKLRARHH